VSYRTAQVRDIDIHYELADYTPPWRSTAPDTVLLHHGYARNLLFWQPLVPLLAGHYRVLRFDARGCGETTQPTPGSAFSLDQFAEDAIALLDHLEIERVHWIGESSGGIVGLTAALGHATRLHTLTLCDTPFKRPADIAATYTVGEADRAAAFEKYGVDGWCRQTLSYRLDTNKAPPELCEWYIAQMGRNPKHIAVALERMIGQGNVWPMLPEITTPTLILAGENSPIVKQAMREEMQQRMPAAKLVTLCGYGHGVHLLAPEACAHEVRTFIEARRKTA
jgi:pimeloyl-ACP methyl ester carboxylesterase